MQPNYEQPQNINSAPVQPIPPLSSPVMQPQQPAPTPTKPPSNKKIFLIIAVIIVIALIGFGIWYFLNANKPTASNTSTTTTNAAAPSGPTSTSRKQVAATNDLTLLPLKTSSPKEESIKGKLGDQIEMSNGICFKVLSIEHGWLPPKDKQDKLTSPRAGQELVKLTVVIGNRDAKYASDVGSEYFHIEDGKGARQDPNFLEDEFLTDALPLQSLASGKQITGSMVFEPGIGQPVTFAYEAKYNNTDSGKEVTLRAELPLQ